MEQIAPNKTRICNRCREEKELSKFKPNKHCREGREHTCRVCHAPPRKIKSMICKYCGSTLKKVWRKSTKRYNYICKRCNYRRQHQWELKNKDKKSASRKRYHEKNKSLENTRSAQYRKDHPEKRRQYARVNQRKKVKTLPDSYVKVLFIKGTDLKCSDIPQELVELKRKQLTLIRQKRNG